MTSQNEKQPPVRKAGTGRFQITIWERNGFQRAHVQYGTFDRLRRKWINQTIWCDPHELRDLANALDQLNGPDLPGPGGAAEEQARDDVCSSERPLELLATAPEQRAEETPEYPGAGSLDWLTGYYTGKLERLKRKVGQMEVRAWDEQFC